MNSVGEFPKSPFLLNRTSQVRINRTRTFLDSAFLTSVSGVTVENIGLIWAHACWGYQCWQHVCAQEKIKHGVRGFLFLFLFCLFVLLSDIWPFLACLGTDLYCTYISMMMALLGRAKSFSMEHA